MGRLSQAPSHGNADDVVSRALRHGASDAAAKTFVTGLTSLSPEPFVLGAFRADVETVLLAAGYRKARGVTPLNAEQTFLLQGAESWTLGYERFPCAGEYSVFIRYNGDDRLSLAQGRTEALACV